MPSSITAEGLHIAIPLFVLFLGGNVADVGIVIGLHYGFSSLGSIFWGKIIDKYHVKKGILIICFSVIAVISLSMFFVSEISLVFIFSGILGFFIIGKNPVTHILVMESVPNNQWSVLFSRISIIASFGSLFAFLVGVLWDSFFDLKPYFVFCALSSTTAVILSMTVEKKSFIERETLVHSIYGLKHIFNYNRYHFHVVYQKVPKIHDFKHIISIFKGKVSHEIGILFFANFLFYFGSNIYFTAFIPFLKKYDFTDSQVFLVYMIQTITLLVIFFLVPKLISKISEERATQLAYIPRMLGILIAAVIFPQMIGIESFVTAVISSCLMVASFSIYSTANSLILFKTIPRGFEGTYLGVNSFMIGLGILLGSLTAGFISNVLSYSISFGIAAVLILLSLLMFRFYLKNILSQKDIV
ncbi:MFS transporter [Nitrosopumilus sp.]|uniref:MFS transporter n=1 Tax=Nitrosopumilus sp. TaxID=2024843 RepID=UPI002607BE2A|nr:MFS transporter [Nitrosopumilus sp.]